MTIKLSIYVCVILFGSTSWLSTNSVWLQLPLLVEKLPEGWSLPSYLAVVVQIASIGPLVYSILHKLSKISISTPAIILASLLFCCSCTVLMAFFWSQTIFLFGQKRSVVLMILLFGMALVNATSNVLFMPYMAAFHASYLTAYFVGMGFSSFFPSIVSILQGSGNSCVVVNGTSVQTSGILQFGITEFNFIMLVWLLFATAAFIYLTYQKNAEITRKNDSFMNQSVMKLSHSINESGSLNGREFNPSSQYTETETCINESRVQTNKLRLGLSLFLMAVVNAQMNGIIPSVQSYACLPFSQKTYHIGLTLSNTISPIVCFLPLFVKISGVFVLVLLTITTTLLTGLLVTFAAMSPTPVLQFSIWGSVLIIILVVCSAALNAFLRTVLATLLGNDASDNEKRLFWGGVFIQIGSFVGSITMFPLINIFHLFVSAPQCQ